MNEHRSTTGVSDTHDVNAELYDILYKDFFPAEKTAAEVSLITSMTPSGGRILDLGCGTGRHLKPLSAKGYPVTGVDASENMLAVAREKVPEATLLHGDAKTIALGTGYASAICMWNAFCELAYTPKEALAVLSNIKESLLPGGELLIQQHRPEDMDFSGDGSYTVRDGEKTYTVSWRAISRDGNRTVAEEELRIRSPTGEERRTTTLTQRWYAWEEYEVLLAEAGFTGIRCEALPGWPEMLVRARTPED